jgi:hypothetical protein
MLKRAGRRLLVSPWFAAGAGVVIATGVMIYTPHANFAIDIQQCKVVSCTKLTPQGAAPLQAVPGTPVTAPHRTPSLPAGTAFWYQPVDHSTMSGFGMWIAIRLPHGVSQWQLSFVIPGTKGIYVYYWPRWKPFGTDGVTVSSLIAATESAGYAEISAHESGSDTGSSRTGYTLVFQVRGMGTPSAPSQCSYNGATCTFARSRDLAPASWPGSG